MSEFILSLFDFKFDSLKKRITSQTYFLLATDEPSSSTRR